MGWFIGNSRLAFLHLAVTVAVVLILILPSTANAQDEDLAIMKVILNSEDKGEYIFLYLNKRTVYFKAGDLRAMGLIGIFRRRADDVGKETYISLNSLYPSVRFDIDMKTSTIYINTDPKLLEGNVFDLGYKTTDNVSRRTTGSAFLNYSIHYSLDENFDYTSLGVPWEVGSNINGILHFSNFSYTKNETDEKLVRLNTNITVDDPSIFSRLIMGDFSAVTGELGSGGSYGGLSFSSSFAAEPFFITSPGVGLTFAIESPSEVEIYVNYLLVEQRRLPPGEFTFSNLPHATGSGIITVVVKDSFGRVRTFEKDYYSSPALLKPSIQEFSYNYGFEREEFGQENFDYGENTFLAFHRFGLTKNLTAGFRIETDKDVVNAGPMVDLVLGKIGVLSLSLARSYSEKENGYAGFAQYNYANRFFNFSLSGKRFTREYSTLSLSPFDDKSRLKTNAGVGINLGGFGSLSAYHSLTDMYLESDTTRTSLFYSKRAFKSLSLSASLSRTKSDEVVDEAFVNLNLLLGGGTSGSFGRRMLDESTRDVVTVQKSPPPGPGFGFRLQADREENDLGETTNDRSASIQYNGPYGVYTTESRRTFDQNSYTLAASGAISFIDGSLHLSRPIRDSFALIEVGELENVRISSNNQYVGKSNSRGRLLVPDLLSYQNNGISLEDEDIPVNYHITDLEKYLAPALRAGGVLEFDIVKLQGFTGYLFFTENGEKKPAEYAALEIKIEEDLFQTVVGRGGEIYLENIPSGNWPARLYLKDRWCALDMEFPESDEMFVDIGEMACEIK